MSAATRSAHRGGVGPWVLIARTTCSKVPRCCPIIRPLVAFLSWYAAKPAYSRSVCSVICCCARDASKARYASNAVSPTATRMSPTAMDGVRAATRCDNFFTPEIYSASLRTVAAPQPANTSLTRREHNTCLFLASAHVTIGDLLEAVEEMTAILQRFTQIRRDEVAPVIASALAFFFILTALMLLRPAREALGMQRGIETIRWLFVGTAVVSLAVNPVVGLRVRRLRRLVFINATYLFFAASLLVFYALLRLAPTAMGETSGIVFFVWFSVFNLFATMVFWGLLADRFSLEQSKRLFGVIAVGGSLGAIA